MAQKKKTRAKAPKMTGWVGWIYFVGILLIVRALLQVIFGLISFFQPEFYLVTQGEFLYFNYDMWGWIHILWGILLFSAGVSVMRGGMWGRVFASVLVALSLVGNVLFMPAYPIWSIVAIIIDLLILYAIFAHGREVRK